MQYIFTIRTCLSRYSGSHFLEPADILKFKIVPTQEEDSTIPRVSCVLCNNKSEIVTARPGHEIILRFKMSACSRKWDEYSSRFGRGKLF